MTPLSAAQRRCLAHMGIPVWVRRDAPGPVAEESPEAADPKGGSADAPAAEWEALAAQVAGCTRCELHRNRTQAVFGVGNRDADWMVIGEGPGQEEDRRGEPFVGRAGKLLDAMLLAVGQSRRQVYIANIVKCRPPNNRDPSAEEAAACSGYLARQIEWVRPRLILAVGRVAAQNLLDTQAPVGRLRGRVHRLPGSDTPVIVTYHPAYLLRSPQHKARTWTDLVMARRVVRGETP